MSKAKTQIGQSFVDVFLKEKFFLQASTPNFIAGGESSQAFDFSVQGKDYIVRFNKKVEGFEKDRYAHNNFSELGVLVPKTLDVGKLEGGFYYSITEKSPGLLLKKIKKSERRSFLPNILDTLGVINSMDISRMSGFGKFNAFGEAPFQTYQEFLKDLNTRVANFFIMETKNVLLEKEIFMHLLEEYNKYIEYCLETRCLVHGDFSSDNMTIMNKQVAGVFDWEHAMYGDFMYDIAWLIFWDEMKGGDKIGYSEIIFAYCRSKKYDLKNYKERLWLHQLYIGIDALMFYVTSRQGEKYRKVKEFLEVVCF